MGKTVVALMIGRGGSSLKDKNVLPVLGRPLLHWAAAAGLRSRHIGRHYVSSDDAKILEAAAAVGYVPIRRPDELASDSAQSCDAVRHALAIIEAEGPVDVLVVQHANVGTITSAIIDDCIEELLADETLTAVVPSHENDEYHPMRAKRVGPEGLLEPFVVTAGPVSANRQELPTCFFFDHSIWALRATSVDTSEGQPPWDCMGDRIKPYPTQGCFDVHALEDLKTVEEWLLKHAVVPPDLI